MNLLVLVERQKLLLLLYVITFHILLLPSGTAQNWQPNGQSIYGSTVENKAGSCLALSSDGSTFAIGEPLHNAGGNLVGRVRIYKLQSGSWVLKGSIIQSSTNEDYFGGSLSLSADGSIIAIGAKLDDQTNTNAGKVLVYQYNGTDWTSLGNTLYGANLDDWFGASVKLSADGMRLAIGIIGDDTNGVSSGKVQVYNFNSSTWSQLGSDMLGLSDFDGLGSELDLSGDGNTLVASASYLGFDEISKGFICIFRYDGSEWVQISPLMWGGNYGDLFGSSTSLSFDGNRLVVGAAMCNSTNGVDVGSVNVYDYTGSNWVMVGNTIMGDTEGFQLGKSTSISSDGSILAIGIPNHNVNGFMSGQVKTYALSANVWTQIGSAISGDASFDCTGTKVCISGDALHLLVGTPGSDASGNNSGKISMFRFN